MADYGAEFLSGDGSVLVDSKFKNHRMIGSGVISTAVNDGLGGTLNRIALPSYASIPIVLIRPGAVFTSGVCINRQAGNAEFRTEGAASIAYAIFDEEGVYYDSADWGMQVFDAAGNAVLDTRNRFFAVRDVLVLGQFPATGVSEATHASVANAYYILSGLSGMRIDGHGQPDAVLPAPGYIPCIRQVASNKIEYKLGCEVSIPDQPDDEIRLPNYNPILVCEVSP